jgi:hypothetical protein
MVLTRSNSLNLHPFINSVYRVGLENGMNSPLAPGDAADYCSRVCWSFLRGKERSLRNSF